MKPYTKEIASYAIAAFLIGIPLQLFVDWASGRDICTTPIWVYIYSAVIFSTLLTLFKYLQDRRKKRKEK